MSDSAEIVLNAARDVAPAAGRLKRGPACGTAFKGRRRANAVASRACGMPGASKLRLERIVFARDRFTGPSEHVNPLYIK